jgi:GNAT superfamily N-acetyltransferase
MPVVLDEKFLGRRVVIRYRRIGAGLAAGPGQPLSDVVGVLTAVTADVAMVSARNGLVAVPLNAIEIVRVVAPDRRQILALERIASRGWRAEETVDYAGWLLRADHGWTGRANSVLPLDTATRGLPEMLEAARAFYRERELALRVQVPLPARGLLDAELERLQWTIDKPTAVLTRPIEDESGCVDRSNAVHRSNAVDQTRAVDHTIAVDKAKAAKHGPLRIDLSANPSPEWLTACHRLGNVDDPASELPAHAVTLLTRHDRVRFATASAAGHTIGVARGAVDDTWLGLTAVEVAPDQRRSGVATALVHALMVWGASDGATHCYIQVEMINSAALALYDRLGFSEHHRYHYRYEPAEI